jgi:hypothetical protein
MQHYYLRNTSTVHSRSAKCCYGVLLLLLLLLLLAAAAVALMKCSSTVSVKHPAESSERLGRRSRLGTLSSTVQTALSFACLACQTEGAAQHLVLCGGPAAAAQRPRTQCCCRVFMCLRSKCKQTFSSAPVSTQHTSVIEYCVCCYEILLLRTRTTTTTTPAQRTLDSCNSNTRIA